ncbi:hypothetical protein [Actinokineospora cianjurensis]|uniref:hypothetical protein n=1 Tax=Actinokineospora cianjurensis TaxID=585224 RepID=UPI001476F827|nr:hypothetical protein [Actinokineospora cianjurensis]
MPRTLARRYACPSNTVTTAAPAGSGCALTTTDAFSGGSANATRNRVLRPGATASAPTAPVYPCAESTTCLLAAPPATADNDNNVGEYGEVPSLRTVISNPTARDTAGNADPVGTNDLGADTVIVNPIPNAVGSPLRVG